VQDIKTYEKMQDTMMLKLLAMTSEKDKSAKDIKATFNSLRNELILTGEEIYRKY